MKQWLCLFLCIPSSCNAMEKSSQTYYYQLLPAKRLRHNNIEERSRPDIFYNKPEMIDIFNRVFKFQIPYHTPFVSIQSYEDLNKPFYINRFLHKTDTIWNIDDDGIPLSFIKEKTFVIEENKQISNFTPSPNQKIDFKQLEAIFEKNPVGFLTFSYIQELIDKKFIEKDGDGYKHGPEGYFAHKEAQELARQQLKDEAHEKIATRIADYPVKNKSLYGIELLKILSRT